MSRTLDKPKELWGWVEEVDELGEKEPVTDDGDASYVSVVVPQIAATARTMPTK